jgi:hypothetical protein
MLIKLAPNTAELAIRLLCHASKYMAICPEAEKAAKIAIKTNNLCSNFGMLSGSYAGFFYTGLFINIGKIYMAY